MIAFRSLLYLPHHPVPPGFPPPNPVLVLPAHIVAAEEPGVIIIPVGVITVAEAANQRDKQMNKRVILVVLANVKR